MKALGVVILAVAMYAVGVAPAAAPPFGRFVPRATPHLPHTPELGPSLRGKPEFDFRIDPETGRAIPRNESSESLARSEIFKELNKENPNLDEVLKLAERSKWTDFDEVGLALSASLKKAKGETVDVPIDPSKPHLLIRRPVAPIFDKAVEYLTSHVQKILLKPVDRDSVVLLPLTFSSEASAKLVREIPLYKRAQGAWMERLNAGDFEEVDSRMFSSLRGRTVVVVGHVVEMDGGASAFEVRRIDGGRRYIPLLSLLSASKKNGFNFVPLGCETADSIALGTATKINDLDAIDAFKNAMRVSGRTSFGDLLSDLSSDALKLTIDLGKLQDRSSIPIDLVDREGRTYRPYAGPIVSAVSQSPPAALIQIDLTAADGSIVYPDVSVSALDGSLWLHRWSRFLERAWSEIYKWLTFLILGVALLELPFRRAVPASERIKAGVVFVAVGGLVSLWISYILGEWLTELSVGWSFIAAAASWFVLFQMREKFPDHRVAILGTRFIVAWNQLPMISHVVVSTLQYAGMLADPLVV